MSLHTAASYHRRAHTLCSTGKYHAESIQILTGTALQLATRPDASPAYNLRLYPLTIERSALVAQISMEERRALDLVETAYEEERDRVEEEFKRGRDRIRERLMEGIEERRRRAREEKDGEGNVGGELTSHCMIRMFSEMCRCLDGFTVKTAYNTEASQ